MKKKLLAFLLTAGMAISLAAPAAFGAQETTLALAETETEAVLSEEAAEETAGLDEELVEGQVWNADIHMALARESAIRQDADMSMREWDEAVNRMKLEGKDASLTKEAVLAANPDAQVLEKDGVVYYIDHVDALGEVTNALEAYRAAYSAAALMGGNELADLRLWLQMDVDDTRIYTFQQVLDSTMVMGSTIKVAVKDGKVSAIFSSLNPDEGKEEKIAVQSEVEDAVLDELEAQGKKAEVFPEYTDRIRYMPTVLADLNLDTADDDPVPEEMRWVVYSENEGDEEYPYLANYTDLSGRYIESLAVKEPGSDEARCGFRKQDVFKNMTADTWTGEITGLDGQVKTVTLPIMRDEEGKLYLGDVNRRIAVADFAKAVYDDSHELELIQSDDNAVFDNEDLYMYYNYLNAWEFYSDMGWIGPDGEGTDVIILKNLCTSDGTPFENACSIGMIQGWQMFGYTAYHEDGRPLGLGNGQDVMAHEYTHTFTTSVMNSNLYENDQGAINEAMSDILGNLIEFILGQTDDTLWLLGENAGSIVRSMSDPEAYQQPSYVWDEFYGPNTDTPNDSNDRGGVHFNSSLLNLIAAKLCMDYGMTYEDAIRLWVMVAAGLTPKTDYKQIPALLNWAAAQSGNEAQIQNLNSLIDEEYLDRTEIPQKLPYNRKIVHLDLPDNETFEDENWMLVTLQLNTDTIGSYASAAVQLAIQLARDSKDTEKIGQILSELLNDIHLDGNKIRLEASDGKDEVAAAIKETLLSGIGRLIEQGMSWRQEKGGDIRFVTDNDPALYALCNITESGTKINGMAVLVGSSWIDLSPFLGIGKVITETQENIDETESLLDIVAGITPEQWEKLLEGAMQIREMIYGEDSVEAATEEMLDTEEIMEFALSLLNYVLADDEEKAEGFLMPAKTEELPTDGLDRVKLVKE